MKKTYYTPAIKYAGTNIDPVLVLVSGEDIDNSRKSKKLNTFEDEIESEETDFWH